MHFSSRSECFPDHRVGLGFVSATLARLIDSSSVPDAPAPNALLNLATLDIIRRCFDSRFLAHLHSNIASRRPFGSRDIFLDFWNPSTPHSSLVRLLLLLPCGNVRPQKWHNEWAYLTHRRIAARRSDAAIPSSPPNHFQVGSSLGFLPSEFSLRPCRRTLSGRAVPPAVVRLAVNRLRGFEHR